MRVVFTTPARRTTRPATRRTTRARASAALFLMIAFGEEASA
jgi:hypothetical protein